MRGIRSGPLIHVAGNSVLDMLVRDAPVHDWSGNNVHFLIMPDCFTDCAVERHWKRP